jgi:DnaJ-class molecular chaperone
MKNYFQTLGLEESASDEDIKRAYKRMAMQYHPDRGGDVSQFQEIQEAYDTLTNPDRRAQWQQQKNFANSMNHGPFGFQFNFGPDLNDIIRQFHGHDPFGHMRQPQRNRDLRIRLDIDLASTLATQQKTVELRHQDGSTRTVQIDIPRGVQSGVQLRLTGHGDHSNKSIPAGDLYVEFVISNTNGFEINRLDIQKKLPLNCINAILGTNCSVKGLDNKIFDLVIPAGTQHGTRFRIGGQGLFDINQPVRGDLYFEVAIEIPTLITQSQLESLNRFSQGK